MGESKLAENHMAENEMAETGMAETGMAETGMTENEMAETGMAENEMSENEVAETGMAGNEMSENEMAETGMAENEMSENEMPESGMAQSEMAESEMAQSKLAESEIAENEIAENEIAENEIAENEIAENETAESETAESETAESEVAEVPRPWENLGVVVNNVARFDNWDHRESSVGNADEWKGGIQDYLNSEPGEIPKVIHQIWVGPKEPPCVWLDTWRVDYCHDNPSWEYKMWSDEEVESLEMTNRDLYDKETMWQCKADILRLEILYKYGGVYIDADMVSLRRKLDEVIDMADDTKFLIMYEPDTKDKPYSVIGNSFIATTAGHPLIQMLILYIREIYEHKRPYHGVEWVTGPLAFTKVLVHPQMPMSVPPTSYFYPQFHFVPNPDAIDLSMFPDSYAFQFGYTCSGLEGWVKNNNRCKKALDCTVHKKRKEWPVGSLKQFPTDESTLAQSGPIPKIIHQFVFQSDGSKPERWMKTWYYDFVEDNGSDWTYRVWDMNSLKGQEYFCAHMYRDDRPMEEDAFLLLALEIVYQHGGYYVPLTTLYTGGNSDLFNSDGFVHNASVIGAVPNSKQALDKIKAVYEGESLSQFSVSEESSENAGVVAMGYSDSVAVYANFPEWTRFLGAEVMFDVTGSMQAGQAMMSWAYDSNVACFKLPKNDTRAIQTESERSLVCVDPEATRYPTVLNAIPGFIKSLDESNPNWQALIFGIEWAAGENSTTTYRASTPFLPSNAKYLGVVFNSGCASLMPSNAANTFEDLLKRQGEIELYVGCQKFEHDEKLSQIFMSIPSVQNAFKQLAGHEAPFEFDRYETHGTQMKAFLHGRLAMELNAEGDRRVLYRSWNDDGGLNCEVKLQMGQSSDVVEWMKVYFFHAVVFEAQNKRISA